MKYIGVGAALAAIVLCACGSQTKPAAHHTSRVPSTSTYTTAPAVAAPSQTTPAVATTSQQFVGYGGTLTCSTVVTSDPNLTAAQEINGLGSELSDTTALDAVALALENYNGTNLADDANQFATDLGMKGIGPGNPAAVPADVAALEADCP